MSSKHINAIRITKPSILHHGNLKISFGEALKSAAKVIIDIKYATITGNFFPLFKEWTELVATLGFKEQLGAKAYHFVLSCFYKASIEIGKDSYDKLGFALPSSVWADIGIYLDKILEEREIYFTESFYENPSKFELIPEFESKLRNEINNFLIKKNRNDASLEAKVSELLDEFPKKFWYAAKIIASERNKEYLELKNWFYMNPVKNPSDDLYQYDLIFKTLKYKAENVIRNYNENYEFFSNYIPTPIDVEGHMGKQSFNSIEEFEPFLHSPNYPSVTLILGEFGTGKTWLMRRLHYLLAKSFINGNPNSKFPIFMSLGRLPNLPNRISELCKSAIPTELIDTQNIPLDKFIFLFDGLDEANREDGLLQFQEILISLNDHSLNNGSPSLLISSRKSFFKEISKRTFSNNSSLGAELCKVEIKLWDNSMKEKYLDKALKQLALPGDTSQNVESRIKLFFKCHPNISGRALISNLLVENWKFFEDHLDERELDEYSLFEGLIYSNLRNWSSRAGFKFQRRFFGLLEKLIHDLAIMFLNPKTNHRIKTYELESIIYNKYPSINFFELSEQVSRQIKTRSLLEFDKEDDSYMFCHRAIWEFLVAKLWIEAVSIIGGGDMDRENTFHEKVIYEFRQSTEWQISIIDQFIMPILVRKKQLHLFEKYLSNI